MNFISGVKRIVNRAQKLPQWLRLIIIHRLIPRAVFARTTQSTSMDIADHPTLRAIRVAGCRNRGDIMAMASAPYDPGITLEKLLQGRFGIDLNPVRMALLAADGITSVIRPLERSFADRDIWQRVCRVLADDILQNAAVARKAYEHYLTESGFYDARKPAVVDVGWKANIQGALGALTGRRLTGYYYATLQDSEIWLDQGDSHRGYIGQLLIATEN